LQQVPVLCIQVDEDLQLRPHEMRYADLFFALTERNQAHLAAWEPWASEVSLDSIKAFIKQALREFADGRSLQTGIWYRGQLIGALGLNDIDEYDHKAEIGYWLDASMQGKGIVTRACRAMTSYAFTHYGLHRVEIHCASGNKRSRAVPERLGFTQEGIMRQSQLLNGRYVDMVIYSMLVDEWQ
jgi:ribosomal-protein-serine acetyltransferase